jgi:hypothetical protein
MFMDNFHTKFHIPSSSGSLVNAIKLKAEENFCMAAKIFYTVCSSVTVLTMLQAKQNFSLILWEGQEMFSSA